MPSFKHFRNRTSERRANGDGQPHDGNERPPDEPVTRRRSSSDGDGARAASSATELGPEHFAILRQIESEGEPLSLAEELAELTERGDLDRAAETLEVLNKSGDTHIAELQRMTMQQLLEEARKENITELSGVKRQDL